MGRTTQIKNNLGGELGSKGYTVGTLSYPDGLGVDPDLQHYVTFFINVRGKSKFVKDNTYKTLSAQTSAANNTASTTRNSLDPESKTSRAAYGGSVAIGTGLALKAAGKLLGISSQDKTNISIARQVGTGAGILTAIAATGLVIDQTLGAGGDSLTLKKDQTKRLKDVITLHMQERPSVSYGINYQDKDLGILGGLLGSDSDLSNSTQAGRLTGLSQSMSLQIAKIPSILPGLGSLSDIIQLGAKVKTNPFREVFFEGIDYRKFNFKYKFMPKNDNESRNIYYIIEKFKEHMHPELAAGGAFFLYPSEFDIAYYHKTTENKYFNKIATCALTDMSVEYGGEQLSSFSNGAPTEINLTLSFRELELLTKETIMGQGY
jgi:hypothetical protein